MKPMILFPKNPIRAWIWSRKDYLLDTAFRRGVSGEQIKIRLSPEGKEEYYCNNEWMWEGCVLVEERGKLHVYPLEEVQKRWDIGK